MKTTAYLLLFLAVLDASVGLVASRLAQHSQGQALARYFEYGRSIEGKVRAMAGGQGAAPQPMAVAGWITPPVDQPVRPAPGQDLLVAAYGMSFTARIVQNMQAQDGRIAARFAGGPGATLSHSYAMYAADRGHHEAQVVVLGILASSLPGLATLSHMTWNFEAPSPHFYPRYVVAGGRLSRIEPPVATLPQFQDALADPAKWRSLVGALDAGDAFYDSLVFHSWGLDASVVGRLARRGWGQASKRRALERFHDRDGFTNQSGILDVATALIEEFADQVRREGKLPVVIVINDRGFADHLHQVVAPIAARKDVIYLSTHELAPAGVAANFQKDGHFVPAKDRLFAAALLQQIDARLNRPSALAVPPRAPNT